MDAIAARKMAGQRLVTGFPGVKMSEAFIKAVKEYKIGNVILFRHNVTDLFQLRELCEEIQALILAETGHPAFIALDQEGGSVSRLPSAAAVIPGAMAIAATGKPEYAYEAGCITGRELNALGINFNLAPVMDINVNPKNPVIGIRSYGDSPEAASLFGARMIRGLCDANILCAAKHFPGHGDTAVDSHIGLPCVDKSLEELSACELKSFQAAIEAHVPAIMTSHILFPQLEGESVPATMSRRIITGLLKKEMGFSGLVLSDCMMMGAIADHYGTVPGALAAAKAGVDLIFVSHDPVLAGQAVKLLENAMCDGTLDPAEAEASTQKILQYKHALLSSMLPLDTVGCDAHCRSVSKMRLEAVTEVTVPPSGRPVLGERPLFFGSPARRVNNAMNAEDEKDSFPLYMAQLLDGDAYMISMDPDAVEIQAALEKATGHTCLVIGTQNGHLHKGQMDLTRALYDTGIPTICAALRNPYDLSGLPGGLYSLAVYGYDQPSLDALACILSGREKASGTLPVKL